MKTEALSKQMPAVAFALLILATGLFEAFSSATTLPERTLLRGRVVIASDSFVHSASDPLRDGGVYHLLDGDLETATVFSFPSRHPYGAFVLSDLALSHWPASQPGGALRPRKPAMLRIYNGICVRCSQAEFERYGRIRRAEIQLLQRRANDPDVEFIIPEAVLTFSSTQDFPNKPGPVEIPLPLPMADSSDLYPENVFYIIGNIHVLDIYPGTVFQDRAAVAEVEYGDLSADSSDLHIWTAP